MNNGDNLDAAESIARLFFNDGELVVLVIRQNGSFDYRWWPPITKETAKNLVTQYLREVADKIEVGDINPHADSV